jgi:uncharacterized small protein (TIGR04563 family)
MSNPRPPGTPRVHSRKQSIYLPETILNEMEAEARQSGRSLSKVVQTAWTESRFLRSTIPTK